MKLIHDKNRHTIVMVISYTLSILFIYAASAKTMDYKVFVADIAKSPLLVNFSNTMLAPIVLLGEFSAAILLQFKQTQRIGLYLSSFIMLMFTLYLSTLYFFYTNIPCSCGGILGKIPYPIHILFNLLFTIFAFTGALLYKKPEEGTGRTGFVNPGV